MSTGIGRKMRKSLDIWLAPKFREIGFSENFPILRRTRGNELDIVELQFRKGGGGFRLNLGVCGSNGIITKWGKRVPPEKVSTIYELNRIYFLDPRNVNGDPKGKHWFEFHSDRT
jgi:hypothetical protein